MKLMGAPDWKKVALSMQPAAARKSQSKKRTSTDGSEAATASGSNSKRARRDSSAHAKSGLIDEEEDMSSQIKHAKDRPPELDQNRYENGSLIEVQLTPQDDWKLASIRGCSDKLYTVQLEPAEQNRHKPTGIPTSQLRLACNHESCRKHLLPFAALPLFCDNYDRWRRGELDHATARSGAASDAARGAVSGGLEWWQWHERVAGICDHRPPRSEPAFRLAEPVRAASAAAPPPGAAGARSPGAKPWSKHLAPGLHARASAFSGGESRRT